MNNDELGNYYELLRVSHNATVSDIHKAYWQQASRSHPDRGGSHEAMVQLVEAWRILSDPEKRARYDQLLKYRHDGWHSRKFNDDVRDARKQANEYASRSWAEFEEIYQKAFYTFNQDFYGEDIDKKATGPYSPLMGGGSTKIPGSNTSKSSAPHNTSPNRDRAAIPLTVKAVMSSVVLVTALLFYRTYSNIGRYVPLDRQDSSYLLMLDTTNGTVYSVEKRNLLPYSSWQVRVSPIPRENK